VRGRSARTRPPVRPSARPGPTSLLFPSPSEKSLRVGSQQSAAAAASIRSYEHATRAIALPNSTLSHTRVARALRSVEPLVLSELYGSEKRKEKEKRVLAVESRASEKRGKLGVRVRSTLVDCCGKVGYYG